MGGSYGVLSCVGEGSTFWFTFRAELDSTGVNALADRVSPKLPAASVLVVEDNTAQRTVLCELLSDMGRSRLGSGQRAGAGRSDLLRGSTVLLVEDNEVNQKVAMAFLARAGYDVDLAVDGADALEKLGRRSYEAVFMDCQMPVMDGYHATKELRRREGPGRHTPVIAMTASAMVSDRERCLAAGMDDFLTKPIRVEQLNATLRRWTAANLAGSSTDRHHPTGET